MVGLGCWCIMIALEEGYVAVVVRCNVVGKVDIEMKIVRRYHVVEDMVVGAGRSRNNLQTDMACNFFCIDQETLSQLTFPSTPTSAHTHGEHADVVPLHPDEILSDEIDGDADLEGIDDNNDDDDDNAFNPPGSLRVLDEDLVDQPSSVLLHENIPLPVDAEIDVGVTFYNKNDCVSAIKQFHIKHSIKYHTEKSISQGTSLDAVKNNVGLS
ncbi:hypothetical protein QL285_064365 [Trifolium repens]|nr:hypothetical protein QL285_064365 [Trifolium repens]